MTGDGATAWVGAFGVGVSATYVESAHPRVVDLAASSYVVVEAGEDVESLLKQRGHWVGAHISNGSLTLPDRMTAVRFEGQQLILCPATDQLRAAVFHPVAVQDSKPSRSLINRFISALAWMHGAGGHLEIDWLSGSNPIRHGTGGLARLVTRDFQQVWLPQRLPDAARMALAFYREGCTIDHPGYSFLSFYKIINAQHRTGGAQKAWIAANLVDLDDVGANDRLAQLRATHADNAGIADYLYVSCRCAVAHAGEQPTVDPEDPDDEVRLWRDRPLIRALAARLIRTEHGVPTKADIWARKDYTVDFHRELTRDFH